MEALRELKTVHNRLTAWAENERMWARRMPDGLEADAKNNRAANYEILIGKIALAIRTLENVRSGRHHACYCGQGDWAKCDFCAGLRHDCGDGECYACRRAFEATHA